MNQDDTNLPVHSCDPTTVDRVGGEQAPFTVQGWGRDESLLEGSPDQDTTPGPAHQVSPDGVERNRGVWLPGRSGRPLKFGTPKVPVGGDLTNPTVVPFNHDPRGGRDTRRTVRPSVYHLKGNPGLS